MHKESRNTVRKAEKVMKRKEKGMSPTFLGKQKNNEMKESYRSKPDQTSCCDTPTYSLSNEQQKNQQEVVFIQGRASKRLCEKFSNHPLRDAP
jgi:hypothetical protein